MTEPEIATWTFEEVLERLLDPNTRICINEGDYEEFKLQDGPIIICTRDASPARADLAGGETITDVPLATKFLTDLIEDDDTFTSSVVRNSVTYKYAWSSD